jgi:serine/threonine protein kinase
MELAEGGDLSQLIEEKASLPIDQVYKIFATLVLALKKVHNAGWVHGDMKP